MSLRKRDHNIHFEKKEYSLDKAKAFIKEKFPTAKGKFVETPKFHIFEIDQTESHRERLRQLHEVQRIKEEHERKIRNEKREERLAERLERSKIKEQEDQQKKKDRIIQEKRRTQEKQLEKQERAEIRAEQEKQRREIREEKQIEQDKARKERENIRQKAREEQLSDKEQAKQDKIEAQKREDERNRQLKAEVRAESFKVHSKGVVLQGENVDVGQISLDIITQMGKFLEDVYLDLKKSIQKGEITIEDLKNDGVTLIEKIAKLNLEMMKKILPTIMTVVTPIILGLVAEGVKVGITHVP